MTLAELFAHPWFRADLADGALQLNDMLLQAVGADYAAAGDLQVSPSPAPTRVQACMCTNGALVDTESVVSMTHLQIASI